MPSFQHPFPKKTDILDLQKHDMSLRLFESRMQKVNLIEVQEAQDANESNVGVQKGDNPGEQKHQARMAHKRPF